MVLRACEPHHRGACAEAGGSAGGGGGHLPSGFGRRACGKLCQRGGLRLHAVGLLQFVGQFPRPCGARIHDALRHRRARVPLLAGTGSASMGPAESAGRPAVGGSAARALRARRRTRTYRRVERRHPTRRGVCAVGDGSTHSANAYALIAEVPADKMDLQQKFSTSEAKTP